MNLIIVESPTKARTLSRFLGRGYQIESTMGHIRDLPKSKLGVDIEHDFEPEYVLVAKKKSTTEEIKKLGSKASKIYLATDPDREGEAIAWHVRELLSNKRSLALRAKAIKQLSRIVFHEITEQAVKHAIESPREIDVQLVDAQTARRVLDRLVGYKLSPLLWRKVRKGLSAGRVQSVAVRLIVEKEREIEAFKPQEYWEIFCEVIPVGVLPLASPTAIPPANKHGAPSVGLPGSRHPSAFLTKLIQINGEKTEIKNKKQADGAVADLNKASYSVASVKMREVVKRPFPPFTTSTMTQSAARRFFWSAKRTMSVAQRLYEEGLITYHRTDSTNLAQEAIKMARSFINKEYGKNYLPEKPRIYKTKSRVAQEAHEAIRPTDVRKLGTGLGRDDELLYGLIWKRFVACQMAEAIFDETTINVEARATRDTLYTLQAVGQVTKFDGWLKVFGRLANSEVALPQVQEGEKLKLSKIDPRQLFTQPPKRYTEATLVKTLEKLGIGRPSTYAPIIETIQLRQYVEKVEGYFRSTLLGVAVNDFLVEHFPDIVDYKFTAHMEEDLDEIANGKKPWVPVIRDFWQPFSEKLEKVTENAKRVKIEVEETGETCPKCKKGRQVIRVGKFGKFLSCSRFPDCDWSAQFIEKIGMTCPDCGKGEVIVRKTRRGKRFYGCSRYPDCRWASWRKPHFPS